MVRKAAVHAAQQWLVAAAQTHRQHNALHLPLCIRLAEGLCSLLTVAPDSALASYDLQQVEPDS